jgi:hypothetical protein
VRFSYLPIQIDTDTKNKLVKLKFGHSGFIFL